MVTSLLLPLFFGHLAKTAMHFLVKKNLVNTATPLIRPNFFVPLMTVLTGFHCSIKKLFAKQNKQTQLLKELKMWQQTFSYKEYSSALFLKLSEEFSSLNWRFLGVCLSPSSPAQLLSCQKLSSNKININYFDNIEFQILEATNL